MATKGDFVPVEDPTLPEGWTKKVCRSLFQNFQTHEKGRY